MADARWSAAAVLNSRPDKHVEAGGNGLKDRGSTPLASTFLRPANKALRGRSCLLGVGAGTTGPEWGLDSASRHRFVPVAKACPHAARLPACPDR